MAILGVNQIKKKKENMSILKAFCTPVEQTIHKIVQQDTELKKIYN